MNGLANVRLLGREGGLPSDRFHAPNPKERMSLMGRLQALLLQHGFAVRDLHVAQHQRQVAFELAELQALGIANGRLDAVPVDLVNLDAFCLIPS